MHQPSGHQRRSPHTTPAVRRRGQERWCMGAGSLKQDACFRHACMGATTFKPEPDACVSACLHGGTSPGTRRLRFGSRVWANLITQEPSRRLCFGSRACADLISQQPSTFRLPGGLDCCERHLRRQAVTGQVLPISGASFGPSPASHQLGLARAARGRPYPDPGSTLPRPAALRTSWSGRGQ